MDDLHCRIEGSAGRITLNRPEALNAVTYHQVLAIEAQLLAWRDDPAVSLVLIDAEGDRAFCAGGDIQQLYERGRAGDFAYGQRFWADEYRLNALIANYPKPYVALMHGFVMGGGVGISALGSHRVVTDGSVIAMPECGIGLIPDVGGSLLLSRAPGHMGEYLGTTGTRMGPGDAILAGFADAYIPADELGALTAALVDGDTGAVARFEKPAPGTDLVLQREAIEAHFSKPTALEIAVSLEEDGGDWAQTALKALRRGSPLSVACTVHAVRRARKLERIEDALALEYRFSHRTMEHGEFLEGVRAAVIDKDRKPQWSPARLEDLDEARALAMLADLGDAELKL